MAEEYLNVTITSMVSWNRNPLVLANTFSRSGLTLLYSFIFIICFFGNLGVILVVSLQRKRRKVSKLCLGSMAVADFSVSLFCILPHLTLYLLDTWMFGELACKMFQFIVNLCHTTSILMAVLVSIERYVVLVHALRCQQILTTRTLLLTILGVWLLSIGISLPRFFYFGLIPIQLREDGDFGHICVPIKSMFNSAMIDAVYFLLTYLIPLVAMSTLYLRAGLFLTRSEGLRRELHEEITPAHIFTSCAASNIQVAQMSPDVHSTGQRKTNYCLDASRVLYRYKNLPLSRVRSKQRQRLVRRFILIVIAFAILNLPYHLRKLCLHYLPFLASNDDNLITPFTFALMYANCAINPILYAFMSKNFRASLRDFCWKGGSTV